MLLAIFGILISQLAHYRAATRSGSGKLPRSAFAYAPLGAPRSEWRYPVPSKAQARAVELSEADRYRLHRGSLRAASSPRTKLSYASVAAASRRHGSPIASLNPKARTQAAKKTRKQARRLASQDVASAQAQHRYGPQTRRRAQTARTARGGARRLRVRSTRRRAVRATTGRRRGARRRR